MNKLLALTIIFWQLPILGKKLFPEILGAEFIQWPLFIIVAILIPFGFAISLHRNLQINAVIYLSIFLFNIGMFASGSYAYTNIFNTTEMASNTNEQIGRLLSATKEATNEEKRHFVAQMIYETYGTEVHYKADDGSLVLFKASEENKEKLQNNLELNELSNKTQVFAFNQARQIFYLTMAQIILFLIVFIGTVFYFKKDTVNKALNKQPTAASDAATGAR